MTFLKNFKYAIAWALLIIVLTIIPGTNLPELPDFYHLFHPDKLIHLFLFGVFTFLLMRSLTKQYGRTSGRYFIMNLIALLLGMILGALTEYMQFLMDINRSGNIYDFIANVAGSTGGLVIYRFLMEKISDSEHQLQKT